MDEPLHHDPFATTACTRLTDQPSLARYEDSSAEHSGQRGPRLVAAQLVSTLPKFDQQLMTMLVGGLRLNAASIVKS